MNTVWSEWLTPESSSKALNHQVCSLAQGADPQSWWARATELHAALNSTWSRYRVW